MREEARAERRLNNAAELLDAFGEISGVLRALDEAGRNGRHDLVVEYRARIAVDLAKYRLADDLALTDAVTDGTKYGTGAGWEKLKRPRLSQLSMR